MGNQGDVVGVGSCGDNIISMRPDFEKQFLSEQKAQYRNLKAMVQKKNEIRINFSRNKAYQMMQMDAAQHYYQQHHPALHRISHSPDPETPAPPPSTRSHAPRPQRAPNPHRPHQLYEVIEREGSKIASIGWHEESPIIRNINMSRSFRRKKTTRNPHHEPMNASLLTDTGAESTPAIKSVELSINTLEFNAEATKETLSYGSPAWPQVHSPANRQALLTQYPQYDICLKNKLTPKMRNSKTVGREQSFSIKKTKHQFPSDQEYMRQAKITNPETLNLSRMNGYSREDFDEQFNAQFEQQAGPNIQQHPFIKKTRPPFVTQRKKHFEKRTISQITKTKSNFFVNYDFMKLEENYRPWTVLRNYEEKMDESPEDKALLVV